MEHFTVLLGAFHSLAFALVVVVLWFAAYLSPAIMAYGRHHQNELAILLLNVFVGWTVLGWITALVWAATPVRRAEPPPAHVPPASRPPTGRKEPVIR